MLCRPPQFDAVQQAVVQTLYREALGTYTVFSFNRQTPVAVRHRLIREFQNVPTAGKAAVCVATYATAAVGITLTAASKVILLEPCLDPSLEAQAAGRIHRLGQTKEVLIKRFAYEDTVEHAIVDVHSAQRAGKLSVRDMQDCGGARSVTRNVSVKKVPAEVLEAFRGHSVDVPHRLTAGGTTEEPIRKDTGVMRHDPTTGAQEAVWEWFLVKTSVCLDCGESVQLSGVCTFRGLASERAAKEAEIERCERRLRRIAEYKQRLTTKEYRTGKRQLTELQEAEVEREQAITDRLKELNDAMVDAEGVEYYTHPSAGGGSSSGFQGGRAGFPGSSQHRYPWDDDEDEDEDDGSNDGRYGWW